MVRQGTGQRVQMLTFSGNVRVNNRIIINTSSTGQAVQTRVYRQNFSGDSAADWLGARALTPTTANGHFTVTAE